MLAACALALGLAAGSARASAPAASPAGGAAAHTLPNAVSMIPPTPYRAKEFALVFSNGLFHMFYMRHNMSGVEDSTERDIGHAVSVDMVAWTQLSPVLPIRPDKWDNLHVWSPTMIEQDGTWYMFYTGVTAVPGAGGELQRIGVATSTDLFSWQRYDQPAFSGTMVPWAFSDSSTYAGCQFRDPFVMRDPARPGKWLLYYVATPASALDQIIVGVAQNDGGLTPWSDLMPLWATDAAHYWGWSESPFLHPHGGLWYLFVTTNSGHPIGIRYATSPTADSLHWSGKYRLYDMAEKNPVSDYWFGPEVLSVDGHDYIGYASSFDNGVDISEIVWGATAPNFTLRTPEMAGVGERAGAGALRLALLGRARRGLGATFALTLPAPASVRLDLYDVSGRHVRALRVGAAPGGGSTCTWDGRDDAGRVVTCGVYFARLATPGGRCALRVALTD